MAAHTSPPSLLYLAAAQLYLHPSLYLRPSVPAACQTMQSIYWPVYRNWKPR